MALQATKKLKRRVAIALIAVLVAVVAVCAYIAITDDMRTQGALSVRNAILSSAKQCCAIEGAYPSSLSHLEEDYGLSVNHQDYIITYDAFAENVPPTVVVIPR